MKNDIVTKQDNESSSSDENNSTRYDRREALKKMGKFAAYTAPALTVLLAADDADAKACTYNNAQKKCTPTNCTPAPDPSTPPANC